MDATLPLVLTSGLASGINAYLVVLLTGLLGRLGGFAGVPDALERTDVLIAAGALYAIEFVTDKIPYVDSLWDGIHTIIRPAIGATLGALLAGDASSLDQAFYAATGGLSALASHTVKTGFRMAVNTSPEPVTNVTTSVAEDIGVASVIALAVQWPWVALGVALLLFAIGATVVIVLATRIRRFLARRRFPGSRPHTADELPPRSTAPPH
ncbi:MAG: DUF4126 domain-containing protein [Sporichthyaceae bacterium]|nr:DUF4126 domain-containing protein [Sporichthyaceae bacterium]